MSDLNRIDLAEPIGPIRHLWASFPQGRGPFPTVVVLPTVAGVNGYIAGVCARLNTSGLGAVAIDYYGERAAPDLSSMDRINSAVKALSDVDIVASVTAATASLSSHPEVDADHLGLLGFCAGASFALQAASRPGSIRAAVLFYGVLRYTETSPTKPISPIDTVGDSLIPVLGHFGTEDPFVSLDDIEELRRRTHGLPAEIYTYPGAGHGFHQHASPGYRPTAAIESWRRTVDFLGWHLDGRIP